MRRHAPFKPAKSTQKCSIVMAPRHHRIGSMAIARIRTTFTDRQKPTRLLVQR
jgi:hypothetical protein